MNTQTIEYVHNRHSAMVHRITGNIQTAQTIENNLPPIPEYIEEICDDLVDGVVMDKGEWLRVIITKEKK